MNRYLWEYFCVGLVFGILLGMVLYRILEALL